MRFFKTGSFEKVSHGIDLSRAILAGTVNRDHPIRVDAAADHLTFS